MTEPATPKPRRWGVLLVTLTVLIAALAGGAAVYAARDDSSGSTASGASGTAEHSAAMQMDSAAHTGQGCLTLHDQANGASASAEDRANADAFYSSVQSGIARFADVSVAEREGYHARGASAGPGKVQHYFGGGRNGAALDTQHPSGLVYFVDGDHATLLGAVWATTAADPPQPGGSLTVWHDHHKCGCPPAHPSCPASRGEIGNPPKMFHAWTFEGVVDRFAHDFPGAVGPDHVRGEPLPFQQ